MFSRARRGRRTAAPHPAAKLPALRARASIGQRREKTSPGAGAARPARIRQERGPSPHSRQGSRVRRRTRRSAVVACACSLPSSSIRPPCPKPGSNATGAAPGARSCVTRGPHRKRGSGRSVAQHGQSLQHGGRAGPPGHLRAAEPPALGRRHLAARARCGRSRLRAHRSRARRPARVDPLHFPTRPASPGLHQFRHDDAGLVRHPDGWRRIRLRRKSSPGVAGGRRRADREGGRGRHPRRPDRAGRLLPGRSGRSPDGAPSSASARRGDGALHPPAPPPHPPRRARPPPPPRSPPSRRSVIRIGSRG